jgi:hypothetical protein
MTQRRNTGIALMLALLLTCAGQAWATHYTFSYQGSAISGSGELDAMDNGDGTSTVTSGYSTIDGIGTFTLITNPTTPSFSSSPTGAFNYDDILYASQPYLDHYGLLFSNSTLQMELNIWGNGLNQPYSAYTYVNGQAWYSSENNDVTFEVSESNPVPEPSTLFLLGAGLVGIAGFARRNRTGA